MGVGWSVGGVEGGRWLCGFSTRGMGGGRREANAPYATPETGAPADARLPLPLLLPDTSAAQIAAARGVPLSHSRAKLMQAIAREVGAEGRGEGMTCHHSIRVLVLFPA